ncbi:DUF6164 family protein [Saccharospirillum mangrovi]|uniref:DUF6164 family protein n=1 Tax=Saccharospirillum mangrovi TaxID=2161747 RepID=UPI000D345040|nr:DUF6164 family protein [Saccharospirillum mangrovi]
MVKLIFRLHNVPDDEADDVRQLLDDHGFETYETSAGRWRISMPGIWLIDDSRKDEARAVIEAYQQERQARLRGEYEAAQQAGEVPTLWDRFIANPVGFVVILAGLVVVALVSTLPFFSFL